MKYTVSHIQYKAAHAARRTKLRATLLLILIALAVLAPHILERLGF